jgi:hypothetical protein
MKENGLSSPTIRCIHSCKDVAIIVCLGPLGLQGEKRIKIINNSAWNQYKKIRIFFNCIFGVVSIGLRCLGLPVEMGQTPTIIYLYYLFNSSCGVVSRC